jgi:hypothetical protein
MPAVGSRASPFPQDSASIDVGPPDELSRSNKIFWVANSGEAICQTIPNSASMGSLSCRRGLNWELYPIVILTKGRTSDEVTILSTGCTSGRQEPGADEILNAPAWPRNPLLARKTARLRVDRRKPPTRSSLVLFQVHVVHQRAVGCEGCMGHVIDLSRWACRPPTVTTVRMSGAGRQPDSCLRLTPWFWVSWLLICRLPAGAAPVVLAGRAVTS